MARVQSFKSAKLQGVEMVAFAKTMEEWGCEEVGNPAPPVRNGNFQLHRPRASRRLRSGLNMTASRAVLCGMDGILVDSPGQTDPLNLNGLFELEERLFDDFVRRKGGKQRQT